jgi:hypothetical protein
MRLFLKDAEDALAVIKVLEDWICKWGERDIELLPPRKDISRNEHGALVWITKREADKDLPLLNDVGFFSDNKRCHS